MDHDPNAHHLTAELEQANPTLPLEQLERPSKSAPPADIYPAGISSNYVVVDFETFYSTDYSLRRMTPMEYIFDPRFKVHGAGVAFGDTGEVKWVDANALPGMLNVLASVNTIFVSHNAMFDMAILRWHYGVSPVRMFDTMGIARATIGAVAGGVSLAKCAKFLKLQDKGDAILKVQGMSVEDIKAFGLWESYTEYARLDAYLCREIFRRLRRAIPLSELHLQDTILRATLEPAFVADLDALAQHEAQLAADKAALLARTGLDGQDALMSNEKFARALRALGVEPPTKISKTTGQITYAFAKTDPGMIELEDHPDPQVQALVAARLGFKSTLEETRTRKFMGIARLPWANAKLPSGAIPMPMRYAGAHTHRLSGDLGLNVQNLPRKSPLRQALRAPDGWKVVAVDASQIEARLNAVVCGQDDLVASFAAGADVYSEFASEIFNRPVTKKTDPDGRFIGKVCILSLGYQSGANTFANMIRVQSRAQLGKQIDMELYQAQGIVDAYRRKYAAIAAAWSTLHNLIPRLAREDSRVQFGPMTFRRQRIDGPGGLSLFYPGLEQVVKDGRTRWVCYPEGKPRDVYGGKLLENIVQHLARLHVMNVLKRMSINGPSDRRPVSWKFALQVHDELVFVVRDGAAEKLKQAVLEQMRCPPTWAPNAPLDAEAGGPADCYGECK